MQNTFIESLNKTYLTAMLDCLVYDYLQEVRQFEAIWLQSCNNHRPHEFSGRSS
jgi:hypothetical protein